MKKSIVAFTSLALTSFLYVKDVNAGVVLPLTGTIVACDQDAFAGVELANKLNPAPLNGDKVDFIVTDSKGDRLETSSGVNRLISRSGVLGIIGAAAMSNTIQAISMVEDEKVPLIVPVASGDRLLDKKKYASRVCFKDSFQGDKFANHVVKDLELSNAVLIMDQSNVYSLGLAKAFEESFTANGGKVLKKLMINSGGKDFRAAISQFKALSADFVYMPIYHPEAALITRQARQIGFGKLLTAGDGVNNQTFIELGGNAVEGVTFTDNFDSNNPSIKLGRDFIISYEKVKSVKELPAFSAMGVDAYYVMLNVMNAYVNNLNTECVNDKIHQTANFEGVGGLVSIDANGNATRSVVIKKIKDQK